jgi:hypothetical protein
MIPGDQVLPAAMRALRSYATVTERADLITPPQIPTSRPGSNSDIEQTKT